MKVRRFKCNKCGKILVTTERKPERCDCNDKAAWIRGEIISNEYKERRDGWRRKDPKVKITKKQRRRMRVREA